MLRATSESDVTHRVSMKALLPRILEALGLGPGDRLVVRSCDGREREVPLDCLDEDAVGKIMGS